MEELETLADKIMEVATPSIATVAAHILQPLHQLLHVTKDGKTKLCWTNETTLAFKASKQALASATLLFHPKLDAPMSIMCDTSDTTVGAVCSRT